MKISNILQLSIPAVYIYTIPTQQSKSAVLIKQKSSCAFRTLRAQALQTRSELFLDFLSKNPKSLNSSCKVCAIFDVVDVLKIFSDEIYDVLAKSPNFTLNAHLHNRQKSPEHSLAGFLPLLTFFVGVCICSILDCYITRQHDTMIGRTCDGIVVLKYDAILLIAHVLLTDLSIIALHINCDLLF